MDSKSLIQDLGIDKLPEDQQQVILARVFEALQKRMSIRLANELTDEQLAQVEAAGKKSDEAGLEELERVHPDIKQAYKEELEQLKSDLQAILPR